MAERLPAWFERVTRPKPRKDCYLCHEPLSEHEAGAHDVCLGKLPDYDAETGEV